MDSMFTLGVVLSAKDMLSPVVGKAGQSVSKLATKIQAVSGKMAILGTASYGVGRAMLSPVSDTINAYQDLAKVQGDIASLGIGAKGIDTITNSAKEFSNQFAGVTANEFVAASYDIKSGISSLTDEGVAKFTKLSAMTARATKSSAGEMTKLFALGYGIFKNSNETDFDFGERMSAQVSLAVQAFRTDGSDLTLGISNIGAQAKKMGVSLSEELAIIGNAKGAFNSASEAATGYRAFLDGAANAQDKLGLTFTDAEGKMLPMVDILAKIKEKYGKIIFKKYSTLVSEGISLSTILKEDRLVLTEHKKADGNNYVYNSKLFNRSWFNKNIKQIKTALNNGTTLENIKFSEKRKSFKEYKKILQETTQKHAEHLYYKKVGKQWVKDNLNFVLENDLNRLKNISFDENILDNTPLDELDMKFERFLSYANLPYIKKFVEEFKRSNFILDNDFVLLKISMCP